MVFVSPWQGAADLIRPRWPMETWSGGQGPTPQIRSMPSSRPPPPIDSPGRVTKKRSHGCRNMAARSATRRPDGRAHRIVDRRYGRCRKRSPLSGGGVTQVTSRPVLQGPAHTDALTAGNRLEGGAAAAVQGGCGGRDRLAGVSLRGALAKAGLARCRHGRVIGGMTGAATGDLRRALGPVWRRFAKRHPAGPRGVMRSARCAGAMGADRGCAACLAGGHGRGCRAWRSWVSNDACRIIAAALGHRR